MYLRSFTFPSSDTEFDFILSVKRTCYASYYPFRVLDKDDPTCLEFEPITFLYGGNGSGKSTALNVIAEALKLDRDTLFNRGSFFEDYIDLCSFETSLETPDNRRIITSDDVFDYLLDIRSINANVNRRKERLSREYLDMKFNSDNNFDNYESLRNTYDSKRKTMSRYVRDRLGNNNIVEQSNGESALMFWEREIKEDSIYILDEPENSLAAENQLKLKKFIEESARFYNCQFIISTHSPFLLNLLEAKIYDLDEDGVPSKDWTELSNVKIYYNFFKEHANEFKKNDN